MPIGPHIGDDVKAAEVLAFVASADRSGLLMLLAFLRRLDRVAAVRPCDQQPRPDQRPFENDAIRLIAGRDVSSATKAPIIRAALATFRPKRPNGIPKLDSLGALRHLARL